MKSLYGCRESGLIVPKRDADVRVTSSNADIVLDPVCGSGTTAAAAGELHRRFICIDKNPDAVEITYNRLSPLVKRGTIKFEFFERKREFSNNPMLWDYGCNFVVRGDSIEVMRTMPDNFVELIYLDPPFNAQRDFYDGKTGMGFSDIWKWDADAEQRLREIEETPNDRFSDGESGKQSALMLIEMSRVVKSPDRASYLTWCTLLLCECRRVLGSYEISQRLTNKISVV